MSSFIHLPTIRSIFHGVKQALAGSTYPPEPHHIYSLSHGSRLLQGCLLPCQTALDFQLRP
eukprot:CAMPEP_0174364166 /NCGR_PEP_ID=MMETSP0811_2-20130205/71807_1 /TAXON_ID=73025 ORGANISM="Eutreptiella gymnastica-like, Strain CCMP1594" /NCGR_SAMPLE_ID=MMETSP0811_2 /ASSEMBLY_ACC=CAM_ASM_000667 /LENGTH=60 /DNA_ID=CAMNT_0015503545 /DNA_START=60 /DNA_END=242 /DNA_ORIENTATION=-